MQAEAAISNEEKNRLKWQFKPGQIPNPKGRPKGSRNKFGEEFVSDFYQNWLKNGASAIQQVYESNPAIYLRVAAMILPQKLQVEVKQYDDGLSDDQFDAFMDYVQRRIVELEALQGDGGGTEAEVQSPTLLPPVSETT